MASCRTRPPGPGLIASSSTRSRWTPVLPVECPFEPGNVEELALFRSSVHGGPGDGVTLVVVLARVPRRDPVGWDLGSLRDRFEAILGSPVGLVDGNCLKRMPGLWEWVRPELVFV